MDTTTHFTNPISYCGTPHVAINNLNRALEEIERLVSYGYERERITIQIIPHF